MSLGLNWTTIIGLGIQGAIIGAFVGASQFITTRYLGRILDRIEKETRGNADK